MTAENRDIVVKYIQADGENHQMLIEKCSYFDVEESEEDNEEKEDPDSDPDPEEEDEQEIMTWKSLNDHLHSKLGHDDVIPPFTDEVDVLDALKLVQDRIELEENADYSLLAKLWVDKFNLFLEEEASIDDQLDTVLATAARDDIDPVIAKKAQPLQPSLASLMKKQVSL